MFHEVEFPPFYACENPASSDKSFDQAFAQAQNEYQPELATIEEFYHQLEQKLLKGKDGDFGLIFIDRRFRIYTFGPHNIVRHLHPLCDLSELLPRAVIAGFIEANRVFEGEGFLIGGVTRADGWLRRITPDYNGTLVYGEPYR